MHVFMFFSAVAVAATAGLHIYSYFRAVPPDLLATITSCAVLLFISLFAVSFWAVRAKKLPEALNEHWRGVMSAAPRTLQLMALISWISALVAIGRTIFGGGQSLAHFQTAWCLCVAIMALSYATGLRRRNLSPT